MPKPRLTRWFPGDVKPAHEGVYEVRHKLWGKRIRYALWRDGVWCDSRDSLYEAEKCGQFLGRGILQDKSWRGLKVNSKETLHANP